MKWLALAVLLTVMQASPPVPRKASNSSASARQSSKRQPAANNTPTSNKQSTVYENPTNGNGEKSEEVRGKNAEHPITVGKLPTLDIRRDWGIWIFNLCLVLVGGIQALLLNRTWGEIKRQADETAATRSIMDGQLTAMREQNTKLGESIEIANKAAVAAQQSAELTIQKERARLSVNWPKDTEVEALFGRGLRLLLPHVAEIMIEIAQHGPTRAFNVNARATVELTASRNPPKMENLEPLTKIPTVILGDAKETVGDTVVLFANDSEIDAIRDEKAFVHLFGTVSYEDVFQERHSIRFRYIWKIDGFWEGDDEETRHYEDTSGWVTHGPDEDNRAT